MAGRVDINTAGVSELIRLPGIGRVLAERVVAVRERVGRFSTADDLLAVEGITSAILEAVRSQVVTRTVRRTAPSSSAPEVRESVVVKLTHGGAGGSYEGHGVSLDGRRLAPETDEEGTAESVPFAVAAPADPAGTAVLEVPARSVIVGDVSVRVTAPDGSLLHLETRPGKSLPATVQIAVTPQSYGTTQKNDDPASGRPARVRGQVIDKNGRRSTSALQVVLWGATAPNPKDADFRALVVATTDTQGHFSGAYPIEDFTAAHATVGLRSGASTVPVHLAGKTFPETVIVVVDVPEPETEDDCGCHDTAIVPRSPDAAELARADGTFSSDAGAGRCVDFTKPDRTLEEFTFAYLVRTTEPEIRGISLEEPVRVPPALVEGYLTDAVQLDSHIGPLRMAASITQESREQDRPTADSAGLLKHPIDAKILKTMARAPEALTVRSVYSATQLSRHADLVRVLGKAIAKAPGRVRLSGDNPVDWDDDPTIYQACTIAHGHILRFKQEWVADGYSMGDLLYSLPLAPGQKKQLSIVDWERRETTARDEARQSSDQIDAMVDRDRDVREVVTGTLSESMRGGSQSSSGSIAAGLGVGAILGPVGALIGVGGGHSSADSSSWQNSSRNTSATALNQLRDRTVQSASSVRSQRSSVVHTVSQGERVVATTESVANYNHCHAMTVQYFEVLRHLLVRQRLADVQECLMVPMLMSWFTDDKALRWRNTLRSATPRALRGGYDALERIDAGYVGSDLPAGRYADENLESLDGDLRLRFQLARPKDTNDEYDPAGWMPLVSLFGFSPQDFYNEYLKGQALKDRIFLERLGPRIANAVVGALKIRALLTDDSLVDLRVDPTLLTTFRNDSTLYVSLRMGGSLPPVRRIDVKAVVISARLELPGLPFVLNVLPAGSRVIVESGSLRYRAAHSANWLFSDAFIRNDLTGTDDVRIQTPVNRQELRNPREEDKELARNLLDHLNENIESYHHVLWGRMSPDRRYMLLDGFEAPGAAGRSVASVVENELVGIVGNSLVLPVARGFHLDPTFNQDAQNPVDLLEHYQPNTPIEPSRIALPTRGVYAEAVMGACNSCEVMDETRFWRWEESPIPDSPPQILPASTDSRRAEPSDVRPTDFPAPIIAMQSAPNAPDPTGVGAALQLLASNNAFRDMAGLEGTQRNAASALEQAFSTATTFGTKAADLALQGKMTKDIDKAIKTINSAKSQGLIDSAQASQLTEAAIRGMVGAGTTNPTGASTTAEVQKITDAAGANRASVSVQRPTGEKVDVDARQPDGGNPAEALLGSLFGQGTHGKPATPPDRTRDLPLALAAIAAFRKVASGSAWTKLDRAEVADRLQVLVGDADKVSQGAIGVCGPAVFFNVWIDLDPLGFVQHSMQLYDTGRAPIGSLSVKAGADLRAVDYAALRPKLAVDVPPADWMVMSALRDSENLVLDFEGHPDEDLAGGTSGGEIASWLRATGIFSRVVDDTAPILGEDLAHATALNPTANRRVIMFLDTNMIRPSVAKGKGRHFIQLRSKVTTLPNGDVDFLYWTWGSPPVRVTQPLAPARFDSTYLGAIIAEL